MLEADQTYVRLKMDTYSKTNANAGVLLLCCAWYCKSRFWGGWNILRVFARIHGQLFNDSDRKDKTPSCAIAMQVYEYKIIEAQCCQTTENSSEEV